MILLENDRLRVEISEPGENPNQTVRFDRAGFISEVTLDGAYHFGANEPSNLAHPSTGGRGFCCEYKANYSGEVGDGEYFPKLGVGLIRREGPYKFFGKYKDIQYFPVSVTSSRTEAVFVTEPAECLGVAMRQTKRVSIDGNTMTVDVTVENTGSRPIETQEYCHNFISVDGMGISPEYRVEFPLLSLEEGVRENEYPTPCNYYAKGSTISYLRTEREVSLCKIPLTGYKGQKPFTYTVAHSGAKARVEGCDDVVCNDIILWSTDHIISPEIIQKIMVQPGEKFSWKRSWTFIKE